MNGAEGAGLYLPDERIVGPDGRPLVPMEAVPDAAVVGIDLYEADGGADALELIGTIAKMRERGERHAALTVCVGGVTTALLVEVELFNKEMYARRALSDGEKLAIARAVERRERKKSKVRRELEQERARR